VAKWMLQSDVEFKKKKSTHIWENFIVPSMDHYNEIIQEMDDAYIKDGGRCPCCLKPDLVFLSDSGIWQASS
jgi:hypothetical protein